MAYEMVMPYHLHMPSYFLETFTEYPYSITNIRKLRATFGTYLLLGLEFLIASDILKTVLEPTLNELALLGGIVVLRTILSVFLNKEIKELESEEK